MILREDFSDTEDLGGVFSGWDEEKKKYEPDSWLYEGAPKPRCRRRPGGHRQAGGGHGKDRGGEAGKINDYETDPTLQHPRCVFQVLKRHFSRYTPEMVERHAAFRRSFSCKVAEAFCNASGPEKTARDLLRRGMDAALQGRADHPLGSDSAVAARQYRAARRRNSRAARTRFDSRLDRHSHAVRHPARLPADAVFREATPTTSRATSRSTRPTPGCGTTSTSTSSA